eukprot:gene20178-28555_t
MSKKHIKYVNLGGKLKVSQIKHFLKSSYGKKEDLTVHDGYQVDRDLSGSRFQAYYHPEKEHLVTVHRGTANMADWLTDLRYAFATIGTTKYSNAKQTTTLGHSLAHALADHANDENENNEMITVNGAVNIPDSFKK